jgi:hypothetical protein
MTTLSNYEIDLSHLEQLIEWAGINAAGGTRNEATTRLHLIDELIFRCFGWDRADREAESRLEGTYCDYATSPASSQSPRRASSE